jgi:hypothetical protein
MKSPFPGMDPYLEQSWGDVHTSLVTYSRDQLQKALPNDLVARVEEHVAVQADEPDAARPCSDSPFIRFEKVHQGANEVSAVADFIEVARVAEPATQRSIRIVEPRSGNRVVTAIEFLSPANKVGTDGRDAYRKKQQELLDGSVSLIEIDLVRDGRPILAVPIDHAPPAYRGPYRVSVVRSWRREKTRLYRVALRERLPAIAIPLREADAEVPLDLQALIDLVYANGRYDRTDYGQDPVPPLAGDDAAWCEALLREKGLR